MFYSSTVLNRILACFGILYGTNLAFFNWQLWVFRWIMVIHTIHMYTGNIPNCKCTRQHISCFTTVKFTCARCNLPACKIYTPKTKVEETRDFKAYIAEHLREKGLHSMTIEPYRGNRFNILFRNSVAFFFLHIVRAYIEANQSTESCAS